MLGAPVVGVGRLLVDHERRRPRGRRGPHRDLRRDGRPCCSSPWPCRARSAASASSSRWRTRVVRYGQIGLFMLASRDAPELRHSVLTLAASTTVGVAILVGGIVPRRRRAGRRVGGRARARHGRSPYFFGSEGWRLVPGALRRASRADPDHRARRVDRRDRRRRGRRSSASARARRPSWGSRWPRPCGGCTSTSSRSSRRVGWSAPTPGRVQNEMARDSYSYLHFPMVAGIVLVALGMKKTLGDVDDPLKTVPAFALLGGLAAYLWRTSRSATATSTRSTPAGRAGGDPRSLPARRDRDPGARDGGRRHGARLAADRVSRRAATASAATASATRTSHPRRSG